MCGRFALVTPQEAVREWFDATLDDSLDASPVPPARYNICPTQNITVITQGRRLQHYRWGFVPHWYKTTTDGPLLINARSETIARKPAFREACRTRRCLIPATGFYEWTKAEDGGRDPFYIHPVQKDLITFAGIWQSWQSPDGQALNTCSIVTCAANSKMEAVHHRMPVILDPQDFGLWLGEEGKGAAVLMVPAKADLLSFYKVNRRVNSAKSDDLALIQPI